MKRLLVLTILTTVSLIGMTAAEVSEQEAMKVAREFMMRRGHVTTSLQEMTLTTTTKRAAAKDGGHTPYYIYNIGDGDGFVLVSGDDRTEAVLGYADSGSFSTDDMPASLQAWLDGYAAQLAWLDEHEQTTHRASARAAARSVIAPMLQTTWNQSAPYNLMCPTNGDKGHCVTGCVATSMAQLMYYYQCPTGSSEAVPGYTTETLKAEMAELPATTFDWANMQTSYSKSSEETTENMAVAQLMLYCGQSVQTNYGTSASSAWNVSIANALKQYFGYDNGADWLLRQMFTYDEWVAIIYAELTAGRPVIYGGQSCGGGHSFVCDGYDTDDYFHFNWGWGGHANGYFLLSALTPYEHGASGNSAMDGFNYEQEVLVGIKPAAEGQTPHLCLALDASQFGETSTDKSTVINRGSAEEAFQVPYYGMLSNYVLGTTAFDYAVQLYDAEGNLKTTLKSGNVELDFKGVYTIADCVLDIPAETTDGTYNIIVKSRPTGAEYWQPCYGASMMVMTAEIAGNTATLNIPYITSTSSTLPSCSNIALSATPIVGNETTVTATITGGSVDYFGTLYMKVGGTAVMGCQRDILSGETTDVTFSFLAKESGTSTVAIYAGGTKLKEVEVTIKAGSDATVTANELDGSNWCTYYNSTSNVEVDGNTTIYTIKSLSDGYATLSETTSQVIKAGEGVILKSTAGSIGLVYSDIAATDADYDGNLLTGVDAATTISGTYDDKFIYTLAAEGGILGFYNYYSPTYTTNTTLAANKAFLLLNSAPVAARSFTFAFDDDNEMTTGVGNEKLRMKNEEFATATYYNLNGQQISQPTKKGLYIVNGKKVAIK